MITKQQKIDAIYEKIARKDLSFGCRIFHKIDDKKWFEWKIIISETKTFDSNFYWILVKNKSEVCWLQENEMEIIGHPVMFGDLYDYFYDISYKLPYDDFSEFINSLVKDYQYKLRLPIEDQSDELIDFIYNLISK